MLYNPDNSKHYERMIAAHEASLMYKASLERQFCGVGEDEHNYTLSLRGSMMGKPIVHIFGQRFFPDYYKEDGHVTLQQRQLFHEGDTFECDAYFHLVRTGVKVLSKQETVDWKGVSGHVDFVIELNGKPTVLELKSAKDSFFNTVLRKGVDEERGYVSQLSIYMDALGMPGAWIVYNKDNSAHTLVIPTLTDVEIALKRAETIRKTWEVAECWDDIFQFIRPPEPKKEYSDKKWTGRYLPPLTLWNSPQTIKLSYITEEGINPKGLPRTYILDYRYPEKWTHRKPLLKPQK